MTVRELSCSRKTSSAPNILISKEDNTTITDPKLIADRLQDQFKSVFSSPLTASELNSYTHPEVPDFTPIQDFNITHSHIIDAINEMKYNSSTTKFNIPASIFKNCKFSLVKPLKMFFEKSFNSGEIPLDYKKQIIIPIPKKEPKTVPEHWRPIVLSPHEIKLKERVLRKIFTSHLEKNHLINTNQHGFRENRSCCTQLISHLEFIFSNAIEGNETDCLYLDYSKAFDKVDHGLLLKKLELHGINKKYLQWIQNFLQDRTQVVFVNGTYSYPVAVKSGVPQGSVLAPLFFIVVTNDLPQSIGNTNSHILTFADDTKVCSKVSSANDFDLMQNDILKIIKWSTSNNMMLNNNKFELISHKFNADNHNLLLLKELPLFNDKVDYVITKNLVVSPSEHVRDLGIYVDSKLTWRVHYNVIKKKAKQMSGWVLNTFNSRDKYPMLVLYKSLVRSGLEYCCEVWNPYLNRDINFLEQVQRSFTSKIQGMRDLNYWERLEVLKIKSLQRRREIIIITHIWKIKNGIYPNSFNLTFRTYRRTGAAQAILLPLPRGRSRLQSIYEESFLIKSCKLWNTLPANLTHIDSLSSFKYQLNKFVSGLPDKPPISGYPYQNNNSLTEQQPAPL